MAGKTALKQNKETIIEKFTQGTRDTGSPEVQVALMTSRINHLNKHFETNHKDHHSKRGLLKLVGQRRRLLNYLKGKSQSRYSSLISALSLRK